MARAPLEQARRAAPCAPRAAATAGRARRGTAGRRPRRRGRRPFSSCSACCSAWKLETPARSRTTTSPSSSASFTGSAAAASATAGKRAVQSWPIAGQQLDAATLDAEQDAVAVELDLVHPLVAGRRLGRPGWRAGGRPTRAASSGLRPGGARPGAAGHVSLLDQQPVLPLAHPHQRPAAAQPAPVQGELQRALAIAGARIADRLPPAPVPDGDRARAVVPLGNLARRSSRTRSGDPRRARPGASRPGTGAGSFGTAQLFSTPSSSSRKS